MFFSPWIRTFLRSVEKPIVSSCCVFVMVITMDWVRFERRRSFRLQCVWEWTGERECDSRFSSADGPNSVWEAGSRREVTAKFVKSNKISTLVTFDDFGVSGHVNHIQCSNGVRMTAPDNVSVWALRSTNRTQAHISDIFSVLYTNTRVLSEFYWTTSPLALSLRNHP